MWIKVIGGSSVNDVYGQSMQPLVNKSLHRAIHKPVLGHTRFACKCGACNAHPDVGAKTFSIGAHMTGMLGAFVNDLQLGWLQRHGQLLLNGSGVSSGVHELIFSSSVCKYLAMYKPWPTKHTSGNA